MAKKIFIVSLFFFIATAAMGATAAFASSGPCGITVSINPGVGVTVSTTTQFMATVAGDPTDAGVTWKVNGVPGGNASVGTISTTANTATSSTAVYIPPQPYPYGEGNVVISAMSNANNDDSGW